jgi:hypothetical protein
VSRAGLLDFPQLLSYLRTGIALFSPWGWSKGVRFGGQILKMKSGPVRGFCSPVLFTYIRSFSIICFVKTIENYFSFEPRTGTKSLRNSQGKRWDAKIRHKSKILIKQPHSVCVWTSDLSKTEARETIPLKLFSNLNTGLHEIADLSRMLYSRYSAVRFAYKKCWLIFPLKDAAAYSNVQSPFYQHCIWLCDWNSPPLVIEIAFHCLRCQ